ncbi:hypothetical protein Cme02nite_38000 [Catellatospora methionotrophica]|uniref:Uncharacterized protein n=1 Tax=Catellatospora methionotrophica TaxID=121620 RepID=A0A8J3PGK9_9ACTN|nr:hypothetical protein [Catellatospora methionotrophica]GIG15468.1 hypothetical protein Cme02nite_38000 [Catellatospora methionotrophica]
MDYTGDATVTNTTTYYVEGWDTGTETWTRISGSQAETEDGGFWNAINAASYGTGIKRQGSQVRIVEEIVMRAQRVYPWQ